MRAYKINTTSVEEAVSALLSLHEFGINTIQGVVYAEDAPPKVLVPWKSVVPSKALCKQLATTHKRFERQRDASEFLGGLGYSVYWFRALGVLRRGQEWNVAAKCGGPPAFGWQRATVETVRTILERHFRAALWRYWPSELPTRGHTLIFGRTGAGKTTLVKKILRGSYGYVVIDQTGEYRDLGAPVVKGGIDLRSFTQEELIKIYLWAIAGSLAEEASISAVQYSMLMQLPLSDLSTALTMLRSMRPELSAAVLTQKLGMLCKSLRESYDTVQCEPWDQLTRHVDITSVPVVIDVSDAPNDFVRALTIYGLLYKILQRRWDGIHVVIDEYHRIAPKREGVEDVVERLIREGRKMGIHFVLVTQSPRDVKPSLRNIVHNVVTLQLFGEDAEIMAKMLNVPPEVISALGTGEFLAITPNGPRRF